MKELPNNLEAEKAVIASVLIDEQSNAMEISASLTLDHFLNRDCSIIWSSILQLYHAGSEINLITVSDHLRANNRFEELTDYYFFVKSATHVCTSAHIQSWVDIVKEKFKLRKLIELSEKISQSAYQSDDSSELSGKLQNEVFEVFNDCGAENRLEVASNEVQRMIDIRKMNDRVTGLHSGIHSFDVLHGGFQKGQYYAIGGRPSIGKTAFADQVSNFLVTKGIPVLYVALESSVERVLSKMACKFADLIYTDFAIWRKDRLNLSEMERAINILKKSPLILIRPSTLTGMELRSLIRKYQRTHKIELVIMDYLQKITVPPRTEIRVAIADASQQLQRACVDTGVPALVLVQLNRESERETRPRMGHLKESGQIEQDADNIDLLWAEVDKNTLPKGEMLPVIMSVEKNKDGASGVDQELYLDREKMIFKERSSMVARNYNYES